MTEHISALTQISTSPIPLPNLIGGTAPPPPPPTRSPRLALDATRLARLQARWNNPAYATLVAPHKTATDGFSVALRYQATGDTSGINAAVTAVLAQAYNICNNVNPVMYLADTDPFLLDWCYNVLTAAQRTALVAHIEANTALREAAIPSNFTLHESQFTGWPAYVFGCLAAQGEPGFTDRSANLRNAVQNWLAWQTEAHGDGTWTDYAYQGSYFAMIPILYGIATGQDMRPLSPWMVSRPAFIARLLGTDGASQLSGRGDQSPNIAGFLEPQSEAAANEMYLLADYLRDPVAQWIGDKMRAARGWLNQGTGYAWQALLFYDDTLVGTPPSSLPTCWSGSKGYTHMRSGWNVGSGTEATNPDTRAWFYAGMIGDHDHPGSGHLTIRRGDDDLITSGHTYAGTAAPYYSNAPVGWTGSSISRSCLMLAPVGSATPDASGSQRPPTGTLGAAYAAAFPVSRELCFIGTTPYALHSLVTSFTDDGTVCKTVLDCGMAWAANQALAHTRTLWYIRPGTFIIWDQWTPPAAGISRPRQLWWSKVQPQGAAPFVVQGSGSAGILQPQPSSIVITKGGSVATIQALSPLAATRFVGGVGYENWLDTAQVPFQTNPGGVTQAVFDSRMSRAIGQWRTELEVAPTAAEILTAITVGAAGSVAPVLSITPGSPRTITVGGSTIQVN